MFVYSFLCPMRTTYSQIFCWFISSAFCLIEFMIWSIIVPKCIWQFAFCRTSLSPFRWWQGRREIRVYSDKWWRGERGFQKIPFLWWHHFRMVPYILAAFNCRTYIMKKILKIDAKLLISPFFNQCSPFQV